jgi:hypothetical protein
MMKLRTTIHCAFLTVALAVSLFAQAGRFAVQLGASPDRAEAESKLQAAKAQGLPAYLVKSTVPGKGIFYRVRIGNFPSRAAAEQYAQGLKSKGMLTEYFVAGYETPEAEPVAAAAVPAPVITKAASVTATPATVANKNTPAVTAPPTTKPAAPAPAPATTASANKSAAPPVSGNASTTANTATPGKPSTVLGSYTTFQDQTIGYSFQHPVYWVGGALGANEMQTQKITGGAMFKSNEDAAFLNAIWNKLDKANSPEHDNDMIVNLILKSMSSGSGTQNMAETGRTVITEGQQIKTFLDLKAAFQVPNQPSPLDFIGKGVIIRASKGILLVVTFYAKDAPQTVAMTADHIIKTARTPE